MASVDFEIALAKSLKKIWPKIRVKKCAFHLVAAIRKKICEYYHVNNVNNHPLTKDLANLVNGIPYVKWNDHLRDVLIERIELLCSLHLQTTKKEYEDAKVGQRREKKKTYERAGRFCNSTEKFKKYLQKYYLNAVHINGYTHWGYTDSDTDKTNNVAESCNHLLSLSVGKNITTYRRAVSNLVDFVGEWISRPVEKVLWPLL